MTYTAEVYYLHEHDGHPVIVRTDDEVDAFVNALLTQPPSNSMANLYIVERPHTNGYPDDELGVGVYADGGVGGLWYFGDGGTWHSLGAESSRGEVVYFYMGNDTQFPIDSEIPLSVVRQGIKEFLVTGGHRPTCVSWQPYRTDTTDSESSIP